MKNTSHENFYLSLSAPEQETWNQLHELFQLVQPQKPEKGIQTLILRARKLASLHHISMEEALSQTLAGATERTHKRLALLQQCHLKTGD